jgi:hypothetical protein
MVMATAILVQTIASIAVAYALWRQPFTDRSLGWALRLGVTISLLGASTGGLMTSPTAAQLAEARAGSPMTVAGAHTVGAPDGGPGLPLIGWSVSHGDLRVPHFVGLHALQALPLLWLLASRYGFGETKRVRLVVAGAFGYAGLFAILLWQALLGEGVLSPEGPIGAALAVWAVSTALAIAYAVFSEEGMTHVAS